MKTKSLLSCVLLCLSFTVHAALQYNTMNPNDGAGIVMTAHASVNLSFITSAGTSASFSAYPSGYNLFGYYTLDSSGNMLTWSQVDLSQLSGGQVNIGNFNTGDRIAFWAANSSGDYIDSMHRDGEKGTDRDSAYVDNNGNMPAVVTMGVITRPGWNPEKPLSDIDSSRNYTFVVTTAHPVDVQPIGQPLPGAFAALFLGGGVVGGAMWRKRRR